jgi:hypothetical protein
MGRALLHQGIPGDHAAAAGQQDGGNDLARVPEDEGQGALAGADLLRFGPDGGFPPNRRGQYEIVIGSGGKSFTQGGSSRLQNKNIMVGARRLRTRFRGCAAGIHGQADPDPGAAARRARYSDAAVVQGDQPASDGQTEAAFRLAPAMRHITMERLAEAREIRFGHARPAQAQNHRVAILAGVDAHLTLRLRARDGVGE